MLYLPRFLAVIAMVLLWLLPSGVAEDGIVWAGLRGSLSKPGFSNASAKQTFATESGTNRVTFTLRHRDTSRSLFTYSKWEIDRWGDPSGVATASPGSWQVVSSAANDVVLGLWGYWGWDGDPASPRLRPGEATTYQLVIDFESPVSDVLIPLYGINTLITESGYNTNDELSATASLGSVAVSAVSFDSMGRGVRAHGAGVAGEVRGMSTGQNDAFESDSVRIRISTKVDQVILTFTNRAVVPDLGSFRDVQQGWSVSLGNLTFTTELESSVSDQTKVEWQSSQGQLSKPGFSLDKATSSVMSEDSQVRVDLTLEHVATTVPLSSYSKWEIDRWGDPNGVHFSPGSWQIMTDAANSVVLGLWGYWGGQGEITALGDFTSYRLVLEFSHPVHDLVVPLHGINALIKQADGFNSGDEVSLIGYRGGLQVQGPRYTQMGPAMKQVGNELIGEFTYQINDGISGQHMSNDGSCRAVFEESVDRVVLTLVNRSGHAAVSQYQNGRQTWSMGLGDLTFRHDAPQPTNLARQNGVSVRQSSTLSASSVAANLVDGVTDRESWSVGVSHTAFESQAWMEIDLGAIREFSLIKLWLLMGDGEAAVDELTLFVSENPFGGLSMSAIESRNDVTMIGDLVSTEIVLDGRARYVRVQRQGFGTLGLAEVEIIGAISAVTQLMAPAEASSGSISSANEPSPNPFVDQLGYYALNSSKFPVGLSIDHEEAGVAVLFQRPLGLDAVVTYTLELSADLVSWVSTTVASSSEETVRIEEVDTRLPGLGSRGFARLRISAHGAETVTQAVGWYRTKFHEGFQTHGLSLCRAAIGVGRVLEASVPRQLTISGSVDLSDIGPAYLEVMDGPYEGHRLELAAITQGENSTLLEISVDGSTLTEWRNDLVGSAVVVRPHWTLDSAYPASAWLPSRDPAAAGQVLFFENGHYRTYYSLAHPGGAYWAELGELSLTDCGQQRIAPGQGVFLCQPADQTHEVVVVGEVRHHAFRQPLWRGQQLVAQAYPLSQSPNDRQMDEANGFNGNADPSVSDAIQRWTGDVDPTGESFETFHYFSMPSAQTGAYWVRADDSNLLSRNAEMLFDADRAVFIDVVTELLDYQIGLNLPNQ